MMKIKLNDDTFTISLLFFLHLSVSYNINYDHNKIIIIIVIANLKKMNNVYKKTFLYPYILNSNVYSEITNLHTKIRDNNIVEEKKIDTSDK